MSAEREEEPAAHPCREPDIRLLGPVCVEAAQGLQPISGTKLRVLLAMLAHSPHTVVTNDSLIDALWGEAPPPTAETGLRVHIRRLRGVLSALRPPIPEIVHRSPGYLLRVEEARVDVVRFDSLLDTAAEEEAAPARAHLEQALKLWRGEPFGEVAGNDTLRLEAERLRERHEVALEDHAATLFAMGEHDAAIGALEALVRRYPLRERRTVLLMKALYRSGRQADALRAYQDLRRILSEELGLTPSPEAAAAQQAVFAHDPAWGRRPREPAAPPAGPATPPLAWWLSSALRTSMLGRGEELAGLLRLVGAPAKAGDARGARVVLVRGEPGVGKTRLLAECASRVSAAGIRVLAGWCDPGGVMPFKPLMEAFRDVIAAGASAESPHAPPSASLVARALTEGSFGRLRTDPETDRLRFFEAMARLLQEAADAGPVLLAIDDIHWVDRSSAALLRHIVRRPARHPVVLVACYRSDPALYTTAWRQTLDELQRHSECSHVDVRELASEASAQLVTELAAEVGVTSADALADRILGVTGGNPLFIREVVTQLASASEALCASDRVPVPPTMLSAVAERFRALSSDAQRVLNAAAVLGRQFLLEDVAAVADCPADTVIEAVEEARAARLVDEVPDVLDAFAFRHAVMREAVRDLMPRSRRLRLHAAAGAAYGRRADTPSVLARASHLLEAVPLCPADEACRAAADAADAALGRLAFEEATRVVRRALQVVPTGTPASDLLTWELLTRLGRARAYEREDAASDEAFASAAEIARRMGDTTRFAIAALGDDLDTRALTPSPGRLALIEEALRSLPDSDVPLRVALASTYVTLGSRSLGAGPVRSVADSTVALARRSGEPLALAKALLAWTTCTTSSVPAYQRLQVATEARDLAEAAGHLTCEARARLTRIGCLLRLGMADEGARERARYQDLAKDTSVPRHRWHADVVGATFARMRGDFATADACAERARATGERAGIAEASMAYSVHQVFLSWHCGALAEQRSGLTAFADIRPDLGLWRLATGLAALADGDEQTGLQVLEEFLETAPSIDPGDEFWANELMLAGQLAWELGVEGPQVDMVSAWLDGLRGQFDIFGAASGTFGPVDRVLGLLAARKGDHDAAIALLSGALELSNAMHATTWSVWAGSDLAAELLASGSRASARRVAETVRPTAERLGMLAGRPALDLAASRGSRQGPPATGTDAGQGSSFSAT